MELLHGPMPGLFKGEMGTHLRDRGSVLWEVFPNNTLYSWKTLCCFLGLSLNTGLTLLQYASLCPRLSHSLDCEPLRTGIICILSA